jgi:glycosyltransferase involved in cell wall biosynthesis
MKKYNKTLTVHMMLCNEERWVWYAIMAVIEYVDHIIIFDTGSTDATVDIINNIIKNKEYADKIVFEEKGKVVREDFVKLRNEMVQRTTDDYFMVLDGDEIYYADQMIKLREALDSSEEYDMGISGFINCAGDVRHYRNPLNEHYGFANREGAITHRVTSMHIDGVRCGSPDGKWDGYYDGKGNYITPENGFKVYWADGFYLHMSVMMRSSSTKKDSEVGWPSGRLEKLKSKSTWDSAFPKNFKYPEVFYIDRPKTIRSPWKRDPGVIRMGMQILKNIVLIFRKARKIDKFDITSCYKEK